MIRTMAAEKLLVDDEVVLSDGTLVRVTAVSASTEGVGLEFNDGTTVTLDPAEPVDVQIDGAAMLRRSSAGEAQMKSAQVSAAAPAHADAAGQTEAMETVADAVPETSKKSEWKSTPLWDDMVEKYGDPLLERLTEFKWASGDPLAYLKPPNNQ